GPWPLYMQKSPDDIGSLADRHGDRTRKVKCDEGRPACLRCVTTGRVCDGYGLWGGGGNQYGQRCPQRADDGGGRTVMISRSRSCVTVGPCGLVETDCFAWF